MADFALHLWVFTPLLLIGLKAYIGQFGLIVRFIILPIIATLVFDTFGLLNDPINLIMNFKLEVAYLIFVIILIYTLKMLTYIYERSVLKVSSSIVSISYIISFALMVVAVLVQDYMNVDYFDNIIIVDKEPSLIVFIAISQFIILRQSSLKTLIAKYIINKTSSKNKSKNNNIKTLIYFLLVSTCCVYVVRFDDSLIDFGKQLLTSLDNVLTSSSKNINKHNSIDITIEHINKFIPIEFNDKFKLHEANIKDKNLYLHYKLPITSVNSIKNKTDYERVLLTLIGNKLCVNNEILSLMHNGFHIKNIIRDKNNELVVIMPLTELECDKVVRTLSSS